MQVTILSMILAVAAALPHQQGAPVYCDEVQVTPGYGPGPACTPRQPSGKPLLPYCDQVAKPSYGPGPACTPRDPTPAPNTYSGGNPGGLSDCKDVAIPAGFGPGPACHNSDLTDAIGDLADSHSDVPEVNKDVVVNWKYDSGDESKDDSPVWQYSAPEESKDDSAIWQYNAPEGSKDDSAEWQHETPKEPTDDSTDPQYYY